MRFRTAAGLTLVSIILAGGTSLLAQSTTGAVSGKVFDLAGKPVAGARVAFDSPALFHQRVLMTDSKGEYRAQLLPVGTYTIRVSAAGKIGRTAQDMRVGLGVNLVMNFELKTQEETAGATVVIIASASQASKSDDKTSTNFSAEELLMLPTSRDFGGAMSLSPGVTGEGLDANIRGGSSSGYTHNGNVGYSQVLYRVDGIDVKDSTGGQWDAPSRATLYDPLPDSIEDIQVVQSALNARFGRTIGGSVNIATKSGSNDFAGTLRAVISRPSWTTGLVKGPSSDRLGDPSAYDQGRQEAYSRYTDVTFSGPIIKDKLWFFVATRVQPSASNTARLGWGGTIVQQDALGAWVPTGQSVADVFKYPDITFGSYPGVDAVLTNSAGYPSGYSGLDLNRTDWGKTVAADTKFAHYEGKLTGQINVDNTLSLTYLYARQSDGGYTGERTAPPMTAINKEFVGDIVTKTNAWVLNWNSQLSSNWFLEAKVSKAEVKIDDVAGPNNVPVFVQSTFSSGRADLMVDGSQDPQSQNGGGLSAFMGVYYTLRSSSSITPNIRGNMSYSANFKTIQDALGRHELDLGGEFFQTEHQFGRERNRNYGVFEGGWIHDYSKSLMDPSSYLFPTFYTNDGSPLITNPNGSLLQYWDNMRGPSAHVEQYFAGNGKAMNNSTSLWVNDTWTLDERWNVMLGVRYNHFIVKDTNGADRANNRILEPRLQIKFNPDGKDREIYSFTAAKLASSYSDDMASWFRTNGWTTRVVRDWNGAAWNAANPGSYQYGVNDPNSGLDPLAGVRWVGYNDLINLGNYGPPSMVVALDQTMQTSGLTVPYALEFTLGYTRNYETGSVRINAVNRTFHKDWIVLAPRGWYDPNNPTKYLTLVHDPSGLTTGNAALTWTQSQPFFNSELTRNYQDVELSWTQAITPNLTFGGSYTYAVEHGPTNGGYDYYLYRDEKLKLGIPESTWAPTDGLRSKSQNFKTWLTYLHRMGKGNVSASVMGSYTSAGVRSLVGTSSLPVDQVDPSNPAFGGIAVNMPDYNVGQFPVPTYSRYYGAPGSFTAGLDWYRIDLKLQAQLPISGKLMATAYVQINNLFNRIIQTTSYDWGSPGELGVNYNTNGNGPIDGRPLSSFNKPWGYAGDNSYYSAGRTYTEFAVGLKF